MSLEELEAIWPKVLERIEKEKMTLALALSEAEPVSTEENTIVIGFPQEFRYHQESMEDPQSKSVIERAVLEVTGNPLRVRAVLTTPETAETSLEDETKGPKELPPIVETAVSDIFKGARIIRHE